MVTKSSLKSAEGPPKAKVFIGSSSEGLKIAKTLQVLLGRVAKCTIWTQGVFGLSQVTLESLIQATKKSEFAILVLTPDDLTTKRRKKKYMPRDNVVFELGLFMGALGRDKTFLVHSRDKAPDLPTDLAGVSTATFSIEEGDDLQMPLGEAATLIEEALSRKTPEEIPNPMGDLLGTWKSAWYLVTDGKKSDRAIKDQIVFSRVSGAEIFAAGMNPRFGNYDLVGKATPAGIIAFHYEERPTTHSSGGVVIVKLRAGSRSELSGFWYEYDADRQIYGGETTWKKIKDPKK